jgi:DNA-binding winged helix-turn-helix (wHTH) protein
LLRYLAEHSDRLISKQDLLRTLWPNIAVTDAVLTVCIGEIRKALGDKPNQPKPSTGADIAFSRLSGATLKMVRR